MLQQLSIRNYTIIRELSADFGEGFSVITGETGAGKSVLLEALSFVLGERADSSVLKDKSKKCVVEALFFIKEYGLAPFFTENDLDYDDTCLIRREISPQGKSRTFINDTPVSLRTLQQLTAHLADTGTCYCRTSISNCSWLTRPPTCKPPIRNIWKPTDNISNCRRNRKSCRNSTPYRMRTTSDFCTRNFRRPTWKPGNNSIWNRSCKC